MYRSSFSQHNLFIHCPKCWYLSAIKKIAVEQDTKYMDAGNCLHKSLEFYYSKEKDINKTKDFFNNLWDKKYKLNETTIAIKKDEFWGCVLNGINLQLEITSCEFKIFYPEVVAYLDVINTTTHTIIDFKSSTRTEENEKEYYLQLRLYAYLVYRKFGFIPKAIIYYLKYSGSKQILEFTFSIEEIQSAEKWYNDILQQMEYYIANPDKLPTFNKEYFWSPYKKMWENEDNGILKYTLHIYGNHIQLEGFVSELLHKGIRKKFSYELKDAYFIKKNYPNANTTVRFWNQAKQTLPLGFKDGLLVTLQHLSEYQKVGLDLSIVDHRVFDDTKIQMPEKFLNGITLRDYQNEAVSIYLRKKIGMLELATGSGKTEVAIEILRQLGVKTLFITDKREMLRQTKERIEKSLGITVGSIGAGTNDIQDVTVATIQSLNKRIDEYKDYLSKVRFVIFDECHRVASNSYIKISKYLTGSEFRLGLSGTAFRDDKNDMKINAVTGNIIHNINAKTLIDSGFLVKPTITFINNYMDKEVVKEMEERCKTGLINETQNYSTYYDMFIVNNSYRNNKILECVNNNKDKKILILTKFIDHGKLLNNLIPGSVHLYGETNKEDRAKMFDDFVKGNNNVLISTISIFSEGIDVPSLTLVLNASCNRGDVKTIQVLGRILRTMTGKSDAQYIDFIDETRFFKLASYARRRILRKQGHEVETI